MASGISVHVLMNRLPAIAKALRPKVGQEVHRSAFNIETAAKQHVPVRTATLQRSIHTLKTGEMSAEVGPSVEYGIYVELGTHKMAARPYLIPSAEAERPKLNARIKDVLRS